MRGCDRVGERDVLRTIYERLSSVVKEGGLREVYTARVTEMGPQIRFCAYNIGDETAIADLMSMRLKLDESGGAGIGGDVERLVAATLEKQQSGDSLAVSWAGRTLSLAQPHKLHAFANSHAQFLKDLAAEDADALALHDKILIDCRDAIQAVRDEAGKAEASRLGTDAPPILNYLSFLRLRLSNSRYLLMCQQAQDGRTKPQDLIRLYDTIIANLAELETMPEVKADKKLSQELIQQAAYFKAFRCYSVAEAYASQKKWAESLALYQKASERTKAGAKVLKGVAGGDLGLGSLGELEAAIKGGRQRASAGALLEKTTTPGESNGTTSYDKPLSEDLESWRSWKAGELVGKAGLGNTNALVRLPPPFRPMPGKPLFFDLALNHIKFPNLEDKIEPPQQSPPKTKSQGAAASAKNQSQPSKEGEAGGAVSGLVSGVKGWFWGSK